MGYEQGQVIELTSTFRRKGALVDPTAVSIKVRAPSGSTTVYTYGQGGQVTRESEGKYAFNLAFVAPGRWRWRWISSGTGAGAKGSSADVSPAGI